MGGERARRQEEWRVRETLQLLAGSQAPTHTFTHIFVEWGLLAISGTVITALIGRDHKVALHLWTIIGKIWSTYSIWQPTILTFGPSISANKNFGYFFKSPIWVSFCGGGFKLSIPTFIQLSGRNCVIFGSPYNHCPYLCKHLNSPAQFAEPVSSNKNVAYHCQL